MIPKYESQYTPISCDCISGENKQLHLEDFSKMKIWLGCVYYFLYVTKQTVVVVSGDSSQMGAPDCLICICSQ